MAFLNREDELAMLRDRLAGDGPELLIVYGRRRVGKTELLGYLASTVRSLYFEATDTVRSDQLRDLTNELAHVSGNEVLRAQPLESWEAALAALAEFVGSRRTLVVLDEFQLLAARSPELETVLSRWWRTTGRHLPIVLVLAGSELSFFEDEVLAGALYGRRTGQLRLEPFMAAESALFHPRYDPENRVRAYSVCGGIPHYLQRFTDGRPLADHLLREVFQRTGLLHDEAELMLRQSIADPANHTAVLRSIAHGHNRNNGVAQRTGLNPAHVTKLVETMERLGLVEQLRPVTASARAKKTAYTIRDHFLRFHFRFVEPAKSQLRTNAAATEYVTDSVLPYFDLHTSTVWEDICREYVLRHAEGVTAVGRWWGQVPSGDGSRTAEREIDIVGVDGERRPHAIGMCTWTSRPVDFDELNLLDRLTPHIDRQVGNPQRYLCSRAGFTQRLRTMATEDTTLHLVTPADIYRDVQLP